jgi:mono/diheme cytochrome c family protein
LCFLACHHHRAAFAAGYTVEHGWLRLPRPALRRASANGSPTEKGIGNRMRRRIAWSVVAFVALLGVAYAALYVHTERLMGVPDMTALDALPAGDVAEGARLTQVLGCTSCHGGDLGGGIFVQIPYTARVVAPNLTQVRDHYDDTAVNRLMRTGAKVDGRLALGMPNQAFQRLTDAQVAHVIAYIRTAPVVERVLPRTWIGPLARLGVLTGQYDVAAMHADAPESVEVLADRNTDDAGRHLALIACGECHGMDFSGFPPEGVPPLNVVRGYSEEQFARLLRPAVTPSGGETVSGFMSAVARTRFGGLTDDEIGALKAYLDRL